MRDAVKITLACAVLLIGALATCAQANDGPYGTAKFESYKDIDKIKDLKVVWDFNFPIRVRWERFSTTSMPF